MKKLPYIEDYILLMTDDFLAWPKRDPLIKLARYDEPIVYSMSDQIQRNQGFTDKQALLAYKIVTKYKKQWTATGYTVDHLSVDHFKLPIRQIDRRTLVDVVNGMIEIRFPYNQDMISHLRSSAAEIPGRLFFDKEKRCWLADLIEPRLIWAKEFGAKYNFSFGSEFDQTLECMLGQDDYTIQLRYDGINCEITNAADSLCDYISQRGGFDFRNIIRLIDLSSVLCYQLDPKIFEQAGIPNNEELRKLLKERIVNFNYTTKIDLGPVVEYANLTNRYPIYVYEQGTSAIREALNQYFTQDSIADLKARPAQNKDKKVIYFNKWTLADENLPILISNHTLMIGSRRQQMLQCSEKTVYYTHIVDQDAGMSINN